MGKLQATMKRFSGAMVQPIMYLAVAGILMAFGVIFQNLGGETVIGAIGTFLYNLFNNSFLSQLSIIFCVGIAAALAKKKKGDAALIAMITYFVFLYANNAWLTNHGMLAEATMLGLSGTGQATVLGVQVVDMGVFLGIILGSVVAWLFNKFCDVKFPDAVSIYGGTRFVFLLTTLFAIAMAIVMSYVWPVINGGIGAMGAFMAGSGNIGLFVYGFLNRVLIPTGLHHMVYLPFLMTELGGTMMMGDYAVSGAMMIWYAELGMTEYLTELHESVKWMNFGMAKVWGAIAVSLAFVLTSKKEKRAKTISTVVPSAFIAVLAGITEPLEFMFMFVSPLLWVVHSVLEGLFGVITYVAGARIPFYGGMLNYLISILSAPGHLTKWWIVLLVGVPATLVWTVIFVLMIKKMNLKTPGREDDAEGEETVEAQAVKGNSRGDVMDIVEGLGGKENIVSVTNCMTRLRVEVKDLALVDDAKINKFKNSGIVKKGTNVQIIIGLQVGHVKSDVCAALGIAD